MEETPGAESSNPQRPFPDAPARRQRCGLHQLPRQRRLQVSSFTRPRPMSLAAVVSFAD